ncbi:MAG TPA: sigma-E processing peptidase SpoIIGA [Firmicutes bacterium]|nr:sigma-E processing peptidase SpoIIGA [Bacillota bacterium]
MIGLTAVVYVDLLFMVNFLMNGVVIYVTALILRQRLGCFRLTAAAAVSALYAVFAFEPGLKFLSSYPAKTAFTVALAAFTYKGFGFVKIIKRAVVFTAVSAMFGGVIFLTFFTTGLGSATGAAISNGVFYFNIDIKFLLIAAVIGLLAARLTAKTCVGNYSKDRLIVETTIEKNGAELKLSALIDTGCELTEPLSGLPVMLASKSAAEDEFKGAAASLKYRSVYMNTASGGAVIKAFRAGPDEISAKGYKIAGECYVGLIDAEFCGGGLYNAVLNPDILEEEPRRSGRLKRLSKPGFADRAFRWIGVDRDKNKGMEVMKR